jgi:hypothetical protein
MGTVPDAQRLTAGRAAAGRASGNACQSRATRRPRASPAYQHVGTGNGPPLSSTVGFGSNGPGDEV